MTPSQLEASDRKAGLRAKQPSASKSKKLPTTQKRKKVWWTPNPKKTTVNTKKRTKAGPKIFQRAHLPKPRAKGAPTRSADLSRSADLGESPNGPSFGRSVR